MARPFGTSLSRDRAAFSAGNLCSFASADPLFAVAREIPQEQMSGSGGVWVELAQGCPCDSCKCASSGMGLMGHYWLDRQGSDVAIAARDTSHRFASFKGKPICADAGQ
jgi:hypothetical protein